jgi:DNA ligase-associated metallophosphoesterase
MSRKSTEFAGYGFDLHPSGALYWPGQQCLIVGDLHLEKASSYHASGQFLPPYDTAQTLDRLAAVIDEVVPARLLFLGDVFHDGRAWQRMSDDNKSRLASILAPLESLWIEGNHDQNFVPPGHEACAEVDIGGIIFRHIMDAADTRPEISAHYHPAAVIHHRGARLRRPCFVRARTKMIIPAFGVLTGGLDCRDEALATLRGRDTQLYLLGRDGVFVPPSGLAADSRKARRR